MARGSRDFAAFAQFGLFYAVWRAFRKMTHDQYGRLDVQR
jgi:hypothetical protein